MERADEVTQELSRPRAVYYSMIARQCHRHHRPHHRLAVNGDDAVGYRANRENCDLRRHDDRGERVHVMHRDC